MKLRISQLLYLGCLTIAALLTLNDSAISEALQNARTTEKKPNILYIIADDLGWKDVGFHGSDIRTPNLDQLAESGLELDQFYTQPLCTPSRAALMTGRYPSRYGLQTGVILGSHPYGLPEDEFLLPQALHKVGYKTAIIGKWHLGHADPKYWPKQRGFDYQYGPLLGEIDYYTHEEHGVLDWYRNNKKIHEKGYVTELLGNEAVSFLNKHHPDKPLFLYLSFTAPHAPYQAPKQYLEQYKNIEDPTRQAYAAMITCMDEQIGRVLTALDERGLRENTLIVFQSDNGGNRSAMFAGEIDVSKLILPSDNGIYREGKGTLYEGGTRVVALANWPGRIQSGKLDQPMHMVDMFPTLMSLLQVSANYSKPIDGLDMWPTISAKADSPRDEIVYNVEPFRAAIRQGKWKLIWRTPLPSALELYDIEADPSEKSNLAEKYPERVKALQKRIEEIAKNSAKPLFLSATVKAAKSLPATPNLPEQYEYADNES